MFLVPRSRTLLQASSRVTMRALVSKSDTEQLGAAALFRQTPSQNRPHRSSCGFSLATFLNRNKPRRFTIVSFMAKRRGKQANPGAELRAIRQQLGWSLRAVHAASVALAKKHRQPAFVIAPSVLHRIETRNSTPSIHRLYALALIYGRTLNELLSLYGIP